MLHEQVREFSDERWYSVLVRSVKGRDVDGLLLPGMPPEDMQINSVGSAGASALYEANRFYTEVKRYSALLGSPLTPVSRFLDFGCGWGRMLRFFVKDVRDDNLMGVDVDDARLRQCTLTEVPGRFERIDPWGKLPIPDGSITHLIAYSVFTHLPEKISLHWMAELSRVAAEKCVFLFTVEPPRFLDFIEEPDITNEWHRLLSQNFGARISIYRAALDSTGYVFLTPSANDTGIDYGDSIYTKNYIERNWSPFFALADYVDDPARFFQALAVMQKKPARSKD